MKFPRHLLGEPLAFWLWLLPAVAALLVGLWVF